MTLFMPSKKNYLVAGAVASTDAAELDASTAGAASTDAAELDSATTDASTVTSGFFAKNKYAQIAATATTTNTTFLFMWYLLFVNIFYLYRLYSS